VTADDKAGDEEAPIDDGAATERETADSDSELERSQTNKLQQATRKQQREKAAIYDEAVGWWRRFDDKMCYHRVVSCQWECSDNGRLGARRGRRTGVMDRFASHDS
jgi:hypothetical protein